MQYMQVQAKVRGGKVLFCLQTVLCMAVRVIWICCRLGSRFNGLHGGHPHIPKCLRALVCMTHGSSRLEPMRADILLLQRGAPSGLSNRSLPRRLKFPRGESGSFGCDLHLLTQPFNDSSHGLVPPGLNLKEPANWWLPAQTQGCDVQYFIQRLCSKLLFLIAYS